MAKVEKRLRRKKVASVKTPAEVVPTSGNDHERGAESSDEVLSEVVRRRTLNRLSRVIGHLQAIKRMVENDREIEAILIQLSAVKSAVNGVGKEMMGELISVRCRSHSRRVSSVEIDEMLTLFGRYLK